MNLFKKLNELDCEASEFGFQWENAAQIIRQIKSECDEVEEHLQRKSSLNESNLQEEIGDLLHAAFCLSIFCKLDPEQTLEDALNKFEKRVKMVKRIAKEKGLDTIHTLSFAERMGIWNQAKEKTS